jgi:hypothetical protein
MLCLLVRCIHTKESMRHAPCHISDGPGARHLRRPPGPEAVRPGGARIRARHGGLGEATGRPKKREATCLIDRKWRYNAKVSTLRWFRRAAHGGRVTR